MCLDFFGSNETDGYIENNYEYANDYIKVVNTHILNGDGYVSLSRILYFYTENDSLTFNEIYIDNLDKDLKQVLPISEVCLLNKYKLYDVCKEENIEESNQINSIQNKPLILPLDLKKVVITSYFMEERIIYGESNVHKAWDLAAPARTPVYAACDGTVSKVSFPYSKNEIDKNDKVGGNHIEIKCDSEDDDIQYTVFYGHLFPNSSKVKIGDKVKQGMQVAQVGTTGYSTGNHLHFQVSNIDGNTIDGMSLVEFSANNNYLNSTNNLLNPPFSTIEMPYK